MKDLIEKLKEHLRNRQEMYVEHHSWCGDTEMGFYSTDDFDIDQLMKEIDVFAASFQKSIVKKVEL